MAMALGSPSSFSISNYSDQYSSFTYDVFLSFRGKDTRKAFTDHLYKALERSGIRTFRDDDAIERGRLLKPELEKAIHQSQVSLIVFSKCYATSKWCLDEVSMIMKEYDISSSANKLPEVVPVFYHIDPTDVRNQTGYFEEAFKGYDDEVTRETDVQKKRELSEKVKLWRSSLRKAGSLTGIVVREDGYEAEFINNIVNFIKKKVSNNALYIKDKPLGMKEDVAQIESWLQDPNSTSSSSSYSMSNYSHQYSSFSYDVFLSFRGEDTRKTFTDHLYTALERYGIRTFRDDDAMERGRLLKQELEKAIRQSHVSLIVFSKSYATSKWCLDEVLSIMEEYDESSSTNKREVVPVFYNIEPTDVRNQTGYFGRAFKVYDDEVTKETDAQKKKGMLEKVEAWRSCLRKVGTLTGMVLAKDGSEAKFVSNVVNVIRKKLKYNTLYNDEKLVGITKTIAEIESWLQDPSPNAVIFVIAGMGGIGKTTIAKSVYNLNFRRHECSCFLANINDVSSQSNGLLRLQSQLLTTILKSEKEEIVWNEFEGTTQITKAMCNKKVLLVLDDVTTSQQLNALLGLQRFYEGSKVIITTRDKSLITNFKVHFKSLTIETLSTDESIKLFSLHAFDQNQPSEPYVVLSKQVDHYCMGLPLALKVLGSYLNGKSIDEWEDAMCKLESNPHPGIQKVLQLSYDSMDNDDDKDLFLHIACFFVGENKDYIVKLLAKCNLHPIIGIKNLIDRCLLHLEDGKVGMHQLIREMGQEVVHQESPKVPGKRSRLWRHEDCINVLQKNAGTEKVEGLMFDLQNKKEAKQMGNSMEHNFLASNFKIGALEKMNNLMLLQLNYLRFSGKFDKLLQKYKKFPRELRLLRWHGFSLSSIPGEILLNQLVVLDMSYSKLKHVWAGYKCIESLKILNLSYSAKLIKTPDFAGLPGLESLILKGCTSLIAVGESIAFLEGLVLLDVTDCRSLRNVPCLPRSIKSLQMSGCSNLRVVERFEYPGSTSLPSVLDELNISDCNLFDTSFANDWSNLVSLKELRIDGNNVTYLPKCIQSLPILERLYANRCSRIQSIQVVPKTLKELHIEKNMSLEKVEVPLEKQGIFVTSRGCPNLCYMKDNLKWQSIDKVERKIIEKLGLGMEMGLDYSKQKVVFEYGIFSTLVREDQIPSCFTYKERGPHISFKVPSNDTHRIISCFNLCLTFSPEDYRFFYLRIEVYNKTKDVLWIYFPGYFGREKKEVGWLSVWRCGNLLHDGDQIFVRILYHYHDDEEEEKEKVCGEEEVCREAEICTEVEECCINLMYDDDDDEDEFDENNVERERKEKANDDVVTSEFTDDELIIRWSDRVFTDITDYVHPGKTYSFGNYRYVDYDAGFYYGSYGIGEKGGIN